MIVEILKWEKPELIVLSSAETSENVLRVSGSYDPTEQNYKDQ